jgi:hypothetical protein
MPKPSHPTFPWPIPAVLAAAALTGCGGDPSQTTTPTDQVTWHQDVAPIVQKHCGSCHVDGGIAPFSLTDYASAKSAAKSMITEIDAGRMPPWGALDTDECKPSLGFKNDPRLAQAEIDKLKQWVKDNTPEGDPKTAAALPEPPKLTIDNPSASLTFAQEYTVDGSKDDFECFVLDPGNASERWITAIQLTPGNPKIDHHGLVFLDFKGTSESLAKDGRFPCFTNPDIPGYLLATWVPGAVPVFVPEATGMPVPAGARIVVQMHYHPTGAGPEKDRSSVQLQWTDVQPKSEVAQALVGNFSKQNADGSGLQPGPDDPSGTPQFLIPAEKPAHTETLIYRQSVPLGLPIYSVGTHMHYVGTDMKIDLVHKSDASTECLLQTPKWDFTWQRVYAYDAPLDALPSVGPGDELHMRCTYNNTLDNPFVARALKEQGLSAPHDIHLGEQTLDEMCLGVFGIVVAPGVLEKLFN